MGGCPASAAAVVHRFTERGWTLASAESLTGGGLGALLTSAPGASAVYVGGVISYATRVKVDLLGVPAGVVAAAGVVSEECARLMADGVRRLLAADVGVATTGVAGPDRQEGHPVGTVHVAASCGDRVLHDRLTLTGDRSSIRAATNMAALRLLTSLLDT